MEVKARILILFLGISTIIGSSAHAASGMEVFAKGSVSKSYIERDSYTVSVSATAGIAVTILPRIRVEGRYTNISSLQNRLNIGSPTVVGTVSDMKTQTALYSLGIDIDILGDKAAVQPFIFVGIGYIVTERSYYYTPNGGTANYFAEPMSKKISGNGGAGFRVRLARSVAFEIELFGYAMDVDQPGPLINLYGTAGIRIYM
jgi:hypothetical protein